MSKSEKKELFIILLCCIINTIIAFTITGLCSITNTVIMKSLIYGDITVEIIVFTGLLFIDALLYEFFFSIESSLSELFIN